MRGGDEACSLGHAIAGDQGPTEFEGPLKEGQSEVFAPNQGDAQVRRAVEVVFDEVKDLSGDEGG